MSSENKSHTRLIVRIVLGVVLLAVLGLGLLDYRAKSNATKTAKAWQEAMAQPIDESALEEHIVGSPKSETEGSGTSFTTSYTWPGIIRSYRVDVDLRGARVGNRFVDKVTGPIND